MGFFVNYIIKRLEVELLGGVQKSAKALGVAPGRLLDSAGRVLDVHAPIKLATAEGD